MSVQPASEVVPTGEWLERLQALKSSYCNTYRVAPETIRGSIRANFCLALANFYGGKPTDKDIIEEIDMELLEYFDDKARIFKK